ncbi:helix-turn-helix domain-containing protein [Edaphobacter flagellatus]|uniref:helix-turn-helix domain-containing protein n=1 Tax=Edaphobacter flagellatus TaxID=1933044 RepID=UPI0021B1964D|nr:helix-turn-helix transcriptional regulator [Edaphobacter flagellatus]
MSLQEAIAAALVKARKKRKLTQEELGYRAGYDPVYINMLERARRYPSIRAIFNLSEALGITPAALMEDVQKQIGFKPR